MRTLLAAAALVAAPLSLPASAGVCVASAQPPQAVGGQVRAEGRFSCATPMSGMSVAVCVQTLVPSAGWRTHTCATTTAPGSVATVAGEVWACAQDGPLVRTRVTGTNAAGDTASATSVPALPGVGSCGP